MASRKKAPPTVVLSELLSSPCIAGIEDTAFRAHISVAVTPSPAPASHHPDSNLISPAISTPVTKSGVPDTGTLKIELDTADLSGCEIQTAAHHGTPLARDGATATIETGVPELIKG